MQKIFVLIFILDLYQQVQWLVCLLSQLSFYLSGSNNKQDAQPTIPPPHSYLILFALPFTSPFLTYGLQKCKKENKNKTGVVLLNAKHYKYFVVLINYNKFSIVDNEIKPRMNWARGSFAQDRKLLLNPNTGLKNRVMFF